MKIGVIIVFNNNALEIERGLFDSLFNLRSEVKLCLINNGSRDDTLDKLEMLIDTSGLNCTLIDIKQDKGINFAIKAGARYFFNQNKLKYFGYSTTSDLKVSEDLFYLMNEIENFVKTMINFRADKVENTNRMKPVFFKI